MAPDHAPIAPQSAGEIAGAGQDGVTPGRRLGRQIELTPSYGTLQTGLASASSVAEGAHSGLGSERPWAWRCLSGGFR